MATMQAGTYGYAQVVWKDSQGQPAKVDGKTSWASSDDTILMVEALAESDTTQAKVTSLGPIGHAQVQASADADLGDGVKRVTSILDVDVIGGEASGGDISLTPPQPGAAKGAKPALKR